MRTIYKYPIHLDRGDVVHILMPADACLLDLQLQNGVPTLWAQVDSSRKTTNRRIGIVGTGHDTARVDAGSYIATIQLRNGHLVLHFFDMGEVSR